MININLETKLNIILPNNNRALAEVLKDVSPKELEAITSGKDLKSILDSILKESAQNSSSDKVLLELVKSNPTLKELGSVNENIKNLLTTLKAEKSLEPLTVQIEKLLPDIKELKNIDVKSAVENSGVFLESKLKNVQNPQIKLISLLNELSGILQKSRLPASHVINSHVKELLSSPVLKEATNDVAVSHVKENPKELQTISKSVENILNRLNMEIKKESPITTKDFESKLAKLENLIEPKALEKENFKLLPLLESIKELSKTLEGSFTKESKGILDALEKIFKAVKSIEQSQTQSKRITLEEPASKTPASKKAAAQETLPKTIANERSVSDKATPQTLSPQKTQPQIISHEKNTPDKTMPQTIAADRTTVEKTLLQTITPIKTTIEMSILEKILDKKIPLEIKMTIEEIKAAIKDSDQLFSKPLKAILNELLEFKNSAKLSPEQNIKEILSNDLKALLLKAGDEISKSPLSAQSDLLKQIDKLSLQIDYYQLVSHLSNASSLYVPFRWEELQEGNITINKAQKDKFYCDIDLKLKEYGELKVRLAIYEKNQLNIHINSDNEEFKAIMREYIPELRKALIDMQITPREIRFFNKSKVSGTAYYNSSEHINMGFEIKA